jgi:hypothetical protein
MNIDSDGKQFHSGDYEIDIIVHGFPGKSVCHGTLGFSTIALIRCGTRIALVDVGSFGQRHLLLTQLTERDLQPKDITDVLLTHSHYDHSINWLMFPDAGIVIGRDELTSCPVFGLRPTRWPLSRTVKLPKDEIFTDSPRASASTTSERIVSTRSLDSLRDSPTSWNTDSLRSARVIVRPSSPAPFRTPLNPYSKVGKRSISVG